MAEVCCSDALRGGEAAGFFKCSERGILSGWQQQESPL
jgi:hypothetical protein